MSTSGETDMAMHNNATAVGFNEGNPKDSHQESKGKTFRKKTQPKLWSEFSEDESDDFDSAGAREQLRKVCLASVGVKPSDLVPAPTTKTMSMSQQTPSSSPLQRTKTNRSGASFSSYMPPSSSPASSWSPPAGRSQRKSTFAPGGNTPGKNGRRVQQDSLAIWQEAAAASKTNSKSSTGQFGIRPSTCLTNSASSNNTPVPTRRRFGGLSLETLMSYDRTASKPNQTIAGKDKEDDKNPTTPSCSTSKIAAPHSPSGINQSHAEKVPSPEVNGKVNNGNGSLSCSSLSISCIDEVPVLTAVDGEYPSKRAPMTMTTKEDRDSNNSSIEKEISSDANVVESDHELSRKLFSGIIDESTPPELERQETIATTATSGTMTASCPEAEFEYSGGGDIVSPNKNAMMESSSSSAVSSDVDEDFDAPIKPRLTEVDGDVLFEETFDIWFTQPLGGSRRGLAKEVYENGMHLIGSFKSLSQFFEFHGMLEWDDLPPSSVIAFCRHGIKPIWEDPENENGGRYLVKCFKRDETESVFTKIALGFFSGMLHDWKNYNLVSLHIRESRRGNDIQLWRRVIHNRRLTTPCVKTDLQDFVENSQPQMTVSFVPNRESLSRNDSRMQQQSGHRRGGKGGNRGDKSKGGRRGPKHSATSADLHFELTTSAGNSAGGHPVFHLYSQKNLNTKFVLGEDQKAAIARQAEAALLEAVPHNNSSSCSTPSSTKVNMSQTASGDDRLTSCDEQGYFPSSEDDGSPSAATDSSKKLCSSDYKNAEMQTSDLLTSKRSALRENMSSSTNIAKAGQDDLAQTSLDGTLSSRVEDSSILDSQGAGGDLSADTCEVGPLYGVPPISQNGSVTNGADLYYPALSYPDAYGYSPYYMSDEMARMQYQQWYDMSARNEGYWLPNSAPPETFCLMPYTYAPYCYTSKGTTYYPMPPAYAAPHTPTGETYGHGTAATSPMMPPAEPTTTAAASMS